MNFIVKKINSFVAKTTIFTMVSLGMFLIIVSVGISIAIVPTKLLSIFVATIGTFIGTSVLVSSMTKIISQKLELEQESKENEIRARIEIENKINESEEIQLERDNLKNEISFLKNMKLDVNSITRIMDLGVAKADMIFRDFRKETISKDSSRIARDEIKEYIGLMECKYTAKLGVDLLKLRFLKTENGIIEISGLKTETLGIKDRSTRWLIDEVRTLKSNCSFLGDSYEIEKSDEILMNYKDHQSNQADKMINNGINLKHFDEYIVKLAKDFLELLLSPLQKELRFIETENKNAKELIHFLTDNNNNIEEEVKKLIENRKNLNNCSLN
ncbi:MAG: hypothetical protein DRG78_06600 [Epsilonproteobacteria bacterium]|nr:MAG: hypothetical protein DRG78_06600 [Campylobacterota bacterium]